MSKIKPVSVKTSLKILNKIGFQPIRQKGSHLFLKHSDGRATTIPIHNKDLTAKLINGILKEIKISREEWLELLKNLILFN